MNLHTQNRDQATNPNLKQLHKNSIHWRNDSGELDVFEAAGYFSAANDHLTRPAARRSLDMPIMRSHPNPPEYHHINIDQKQIKDQSKKFKQPSSPGGRLATFLNSLFNQTPLKKKKKSSKSAAAAKDFDEETPGGGGRRKRRSSISHFRITTTAKTTAADAGSGFRTPPPYAITPTKSYKELARFADRNAIALPKICAETRNGGDRDWIEEKLRISEKINGGNAKKLMNEEEEDGAESDSSSDLFDLPNHDLDFFSNSLPVYESTRMEKIRIAPTISTAT